MSATVIPARAAIARAIVRERDALDPDSPERRQLNQRAYESLLRWACEVDLTGLEVWWGNGEYCAGRVLRMVDGPERGRVLFTGEPADDENGSALWEVLAAGWLQLPGDVRDPGSDGSLATIRALERQGGPS